MASLIRNLIAAFFVGLCIISFQRGHEFLGFMVIGLVLAILNPESPKYKNDLVWMNEALINPEFLKQRKDSANRYKSMINGIVHGVIKQGMSGEEIRSIFKDTLPSFYLGEVSSSNGAEAVFYGYGEGLPTPILTLKFREGKLIDYKLTPQDDAELRYAFRSKLKE